MTRAVISTIGQDRPGIVNALTEIVHELGLNIEDSRMTVLGGEFAVLMSVTGDETGLTALENRLLAFSESADMACLFRRTADRTPGQSLPYRVRVIAMDHPGIVRGVAGFFSSRQVNIRELETEAERAAHTGTQIFNLSMTVEVPVGLKIARLRDEFEDFCDARDLDGELFAE